MPELAGADDPERADPERAESGRPESGAPERAVPDPPERMVPARPGPVVRGLRWIRQQLAFLIIVAGLVAGFVYLLVESGHWRRGTAVLAVVALLAGVLRAVLPSAHVGMLAVRNRWLDAVCFLLVGGLMLAVDIRLRG